MVGFSASRGSPFVRRCVVLIAPCAVLEGLTARSRNYRHTEGMLMIEDAPHCRAIACRP